MLRPELIDALRDATPSAPLSLRAHVRALEPAPPRRRITKRRLAVALTAAAACAAAVVAVAVALTSSPRPASPALAESVPYNPTSRSFIGSPTTGAEVVLPGASTSRVQRYGATLHLRLPTGPAVATASRQAIAVAERLGGFEQSIRVSVTAKAGSAVLVLRVPRASVTTAIAQLSRFGVVIGEQLSVTDLQTGIDTIGLRIEQLERSLAAAIHAPPTPMSQRRIAALSAEIVALQRTRAATTRSAANATVSLDLSTPGHVHPPKPHRARGPFHALGVAFRDAGIGVLYLLALGTPLALVIALGVLAFARLRRRRDERLLSRS